MKSTNELIRQYLRSVRRELSCPLRQKNSLLRRLRRDLEDFADEFGSEVQAADLEAHFGTAQEIAAALCPTDEQARPHSVLRRLIPAFIAAPVLLAAILLVSIHTMLNTPDIPEISIHSFPDYGYKYTGGKTAVYRDASGKALMTVRVESEYRNNTLTVKPYSAAISVEIHDPGVQVNEQYAYYSGNVVYGYTNVTYNGKTSSQYIRVYCDENGRFT